MNIEDRLNAILSNELTTDIERLIAQAIQATNTKKRQKAIASHYSTASYTGTIKAVANKNSITKQDIELVLLPLDVPNANKQMVPASEATNIIDTAFYSPIRASFDGKSIKGHDGAIEVGVINDVYRRDNTIFAKGVIWKDHNSDLLTYLQKQDFIGTSYEIYYGRVETQNGIQVLYDTIFAGQAIVKNPAYLDQTPATLL